MNRNDYYQQLNQNQDFILKVNQDPFRLKYHLMPPSGWLNDPNGLCFINNKTHIYFQYSPFTAGWGMKLWGHYSTENFQDYVEYEPFLYPDIDEDRDGVYSGSAFVEDEKIHYFYTGNVKYKDKAYNYDYEGREQNTIYFTSNDGITKTDKKVIFRNEDYPDFVGVHVRDPKVFKENNQYYMILGARTKQDEGCALIYKSSDLENWTYHFMIKTDDKFGYMWECPDLVKIENQYFLICSPQGLKEEGIDYANVYQVGYFKIEIDFDQKTYQLGKFYELDRGFDIYAPQTYTINDEVRLIGWMGIPDANYSNEQTVKYNWQHALTLPRKLSVKADRLIQQPIKEILDLRYNAKPYLVANDLTLTTQDTFVLELNELDSNQDFQVQLSCDIILEYKDRLCTLKMAESGLGRTSRSVKVKTLNSIMIFKDTSSLEIFINEGEEVFTSRIYPKTNQLKVLGKAKATLSEIKHFNYIKG